MDPDTSTAGDLLVATRRMKRLARAVLGNEHDADDAAQDAWCRVLDSPGATKRGEAWLAGVARNVAREKRRALRRRRKREERSARPETKSADQSALDQIDALQSLVQVVRSIEQPYRSALVLQYVIGLDPAQAAEALGVNRATHRSRVHRGLALMRAQLDGEDRASRRTWQALITPLLTEALPAFAGGSVVSKSTTALGGALLLLLIGGVAHVGLASRDAEHSNRESPTEARSTGTPRLEGLTTSAGTDREESHSAAPETRRDEPSAPRKVRFSVRVTVQSENEKLKFDRAAWIYAIPAVNPASSEEGRDDGVRTPWRGGNEPLVLELPAGGLWYVGVNTRWGATRGDAIEVTEGETADVGLMLPDPEATRCESVTVVIAESGLAEVASEYEPVVRIRALAVPGRTYSQHPGPGEWPHPRTRTLSARWSEPLTVPCYDAEARYAVSVSLARILSDERRGRPTGDKQAASGRWLIGPDRSIVTPGGTARFLVQRTGTLMVRIEWPDDMKPGEALRIRMEPADNKATARVQMEPAGDRIGFPVRDVGGIVTPGLWNLKWSGRGWNPGQVPSVVVGAGSTEVLQVFPERSGKTPASPPQHQEESERLSPRARQLRARFPIQVKGIATLGPAESSEYGTFFGLYGVARTEAGLSHTVEHEHAHAKHDGQIPVESLSSRSGLAGEWSTLDAISAVRLPWHVARLAGTVSEGRSESIRFTEGGYLVAVPSKYPRGTSMRLAATDGGVLTTVHPEALRRGRLDAVADARDAGRSVAIAPGTLIGPLPPGSYEFEILQGGAAVARVRGQVEAARVSALPIDLGPAEVK